MREQRRHDDTDQQDKRSESRWKQFFLGQALQASLRWVLDNWPDIFG